MKLVSAITDIRQLCCLGLGGQAVMPTLFHSIQKLVPCGFQVFFWADKNFEITNMFCLNLPSVAHLASLYLAEFVNKREREVKPSFSELIKTERGVVDWDRFMNPRFFRSDYYNAILKPLDGRHVIGTIIHESDRVLGELVMFRAPADPPFALKEKRLLAALTPYIAHGLSASFHSERESSYIDSGEQGLLVLNHKGDIQYASPRSRELLFWATHPEISRSAIPDKPATSPALTQLCKNLIGIFRGQPNPAPVLHHTNAWGRFCFRAYWLEEWERSTHPMIGVTLKYQRPLLLALYERMQAYPLSSRQKEVCQLLAQGYSFPRISKQLNITSHTLVDYVRRIYQKLEVHSREELLVKLGTSAAQMDAAPVDVH